jgi:hypothetical protein
MRLQTPKLDVGDGRTRSRVGNRGIGGLVSDQPWIGPHQYAVPVSSSAVQLIVDNDGLTARKRE